MQPYQRATEELLSGKRQAGHAALGAAVLGIKGSTLVRGLSSLLQPGVSSGVALQGMSKLNPYIKKFGDIAKKFGYSEDDIVDHMRETTEKQPSVKSLFQQLVGDIDFSQLDEQSTKALSNYSRLAQKLEDQGKTLKDPVVKKLKKKIDKVLQGIGGIETEAMAMQQPAQNQFPGGMQMQQPQQQMGQGQVALSQSIAQALDFLGRRRG